MTWVEWYVAALYTMLERGGTVEVIDAVVDEVNRPTDRGLAKYLQTRAEVHEQVGPCARCGDSFDPPETTPKLDQEMLCQTCAKPTTSPS